MIMRTKEYRSASSRARTHVCMHTPKYSLSIHTHCWQQKSMPVSPGLVLGAVMVSSRKHWNRRPFELVTQFCVCKQAQSGHEFWVKVSKVLHLWGIVCTSGCGPGCSIPSLPVAFWVRSWEDNILLLCGAKRARRVAWFLCETLCAWQ